MKHINILVEDLSKIYGENLVSVVKYGDDDSLLAIFNRLDAKDIKLATPAIKKWINTKKPLPIVMSEGEWLDSADIYPIEYTEIKHNYKILFGKDVVEPIAVSKQNLRLKCEYEVKNLLVKIREVYLGNSDNLQVMDKTLENVAINVVRILKSALVLFDAPACGNYREIIQKMSENVDFDGEVFVKIISTKENNKRIPKFKIEEDVQRIINAIFSLYNYINDWQEQ